MIVVPPIEINDLNLTSSTVGEPNAPADYSGATTYVEGQMATDPASKLVYQSLQGGNLNHAPASSPLWWEVIGYKEVAWASGTTYAASTDAAPVFVLYNHRIYESLQGTNLGNNPYASPAFWQDIGPSLQYAMFDTLRSTASVGASPLQAVITPGTRVDTVAVIGVDADSVRVQMTSAGVTVYDQTATMTSREVSNWYDYYFKPFNIVTAYLFQNLPPYTNGVITVTATKATGNAAIGAVCMGLAVDLGITQNNPENDAINYSTISRDDFGNAILVQKRAVPKTTQQVLADASQINDIVAARTALNAVPAVWAGLTDNSSDYFPPLLILGVWMQWKLTLQKPAKVMQTIELQEV